MKSIKSNYFYGNEVSEYAKENGWVDYETLAKAFDAVMNNDIISETSRMGVEWELVHGCEEDEEGNYHEIFQYFIISPSGYEVLEYWTDEIVFYSEQLNMYVWGVCHFGTSWDYVLTEIKIDRGDA